MNGQNVFNNRKSQYEIMNEECMVQNTGQDRG